MPNVITTCAKCRFRYEYFFDGRNYVPCPRCGYDPIGSLERATTADLLSQLHSSDRTTRNNAAVALGERRAQEATDSLLAMLASEGASVETGVIVALGHLREKRAAENLITLLKTHPERGHIIGALLRIGTDQALDAVLATNPYDFSISTLQALVQFPGDKVAAVLAKLALGDEGNNRPEKTKAAIASLGEVGGDLAIAALKTSLEDPRKEIVLAAYKSLARIRYKPADEAERVMLILAGDDWHELSNMGADAVPLLERILVSSPSREMRRSAAVALQRLLWTPADESQKIAFFLALGEFDHLVALGDSAVNQMIAVMSDKNYGERRRVPAALAEMELGSESKLQVFNALVSCLNTTEEMAVAATTTLGDMGCPDAVLPLIAQLDQWKGRAWTDEATVHALCVALGKLGDARAADLLKAFANDKLQYQSVQKAAQAALVNVLGPQAAEPELKIPPPIQAPVAIESTTSVTPRAEPIFEKKWWRFWR